MCTSQIEMTLSCRNLINMDILSKSDPYCVVLMKDSWQEKFYEIGRTETIWDCLCPEWVRKFILDYSFESLQKIRFEVWDQDPNGKDFLGAHETTLAEIVSFKSRQYVRRLTGNKNVNKNRGEIIVVAEELSSCKLVAQMQFSAEDLPRPFCGLIRPDPFLVISRCNEDGTFSVVAKSNTYKSSCNPVWTPINISVRTLCNGDFERTIKIDCYDQRANGSHQLIGSCTTLLSELTNEISRNTCKKFSLKKPSTKPIPEKILHQPTLFVLDVILAREVTFLDYIKSGTQMHFAVAIDFTSSNGDPKDPQSLHYLDPSGMSQNPYEIALHAVGEIISQYNTSGLYPAFGFGAKLSESGQVSHQFPLNGNQAHPYCTTIAEIVEHYRKALASVTLHGPTNFSPVIHNTAQIATKYMDGKHYFILLIITDGIISDMFQTKRQIVEASTLPLSIIIVGVGDADFSQMDRLDSDDELLSVDGRRAKRDIVQFVPINKFLSRRVPGIRSKADLAKEVLAEIPDQMTGYMKTKGFIPKPEDYRKTAVSFAK